MKNIHIFTNTLLSGGAEKQLVLLANELCELYNITIIIYHKNSTNDKLLQQISNKNIQLKFLQGNFFVKFVQLIKFLKKNRNAILLNYLLLPNLFGGIAASLTGTKSFGGIRSSILDNKKILLNKIAHNLINHKTIFNNYSGKENCTKLGFKESKSIVIPNGIEMPNIKPTRKNNETPVVISVGRFAAVKDYNTALKSILELKNKDLNFKYWIVGWGEKEVDIKHTINKYNLEKNVTVFINPENLCELYQNADIYLQTSLFEGLSNTVMEAMSYSLPSVVTEVGDNNRLIHNQRTGFLCRTGDYKDISQKLEILISNYDTRINFGKCAYDHINENYSVERLSTNYINLINSISED